MIAPIGTPFAQQRRDQARFERRQLAASLSVRKLGLELCCKIVNVNRLPVEHGSASYASRG